MGKPIGLKHAFHVVYLKLYVLIFSVYSLPADVAHLLYNPFISYVYIRLTPTPHTKTCISCKNRLPNPDLGGGTPLILRVPFLGPFLKHVLANVGSILEAMLGTFWIHCWVHF